MVTAAKMATALGVSSRLGLKATQVFRSQCGASACVFAQKGGRRWMSGDATQPTETAAAPPAAEATPTEENQVGPAGQKPIQHLLSPVCLQCGGGHWLLECTQRPMNDWATWKDEYPARALGHERLTAITASLEAAGVITSLKAGQSTTTFTSTGSQTTNTFASRLTSGGQQPHRRQTYQKPPQQANQPGSIEALSALISQMTDPAAMGDGGKRERFQRTSPSRGGSRGGFGQGGKGGQTGGVGGLL
eukprot:comp24103_c0_seq1/m.43541 comp24103_c0_seq1/g.43541  ORF comp24103_c0_seq1/g.43541 comp24103_c0_seq1/m.43541 type:complete len:247 (-) comp24103_c0_seq1:87-827(-)